MSPVPLQHMGKRERAATPILFALYLVDLVRSVADCQYVSALWVARDTVYRTILPESAVWDVDRDARTYVGPYPIIAHPPCGPWGKLAWRSREDPEHGRIAMEMVHRYGGLVEQPLGSSLFREHGRHGDVLTVNQKDYGHRALKPTLLYVVGRNLSG